MMVFFFIILKRIKLSTTNPSFNEITLALHVCLFVCFTFLILCFKLVLFVCMFVKEVKEDDDDEKTKCYKRFDVACYSHDEGQVH